MFSGWSWLWWGVYGAGVGFFGLNPDVHVPSISPYSDFDLPATLRYTSRPGKAWVKGPLRTFRVTAYTDRPGLWTPLRYRAAMQMARWYFRRCRIVLPMVPLRRLPKHTLTRKGLVQWRLSRDLRKTSDPHETLLFFTKSVVYEWGSPKKKVPLLGVSAHIWMHARKKWTKRPAVWTRLSPVYSTLAHELGHRLGLKHTRKPYHLMLNGPGVRSSFATLWTSALGYFAPRRFLFSPRQCRVMLRTLDQEQGRKRKLPILRVLRPIQPLKPRPKAPPQKR